jgi:GNAT superfamily N-acetyltransferase
VPSFEIASDPAAFEQEASRIRAGLRAHNDAAAGDAAFQLLRVIVRSEAGELIGGLLGATYWGWLHVEVLWVDAAHRRRGCGTRLLALAESEALRRGCRDAFLDTFSFQARPLYERLGYRVVGTLDDFPSGHQRTFMAKRLERGDPA